MQRTHNSWLTLCFQTDGRTIQSHSCHIFFIISCSCKFVTKYIINVITFLGRFVHFYKNEPISFPTSVVDRIVVAFDMRSFRPTKICRYVLMLVKITQQWWKLHSKTYVRLYAGSDWVENPRVKNSQPAALPCGGLPPWLRHHPDDRLKTLRTCKGFSPQTTPPLAPFGKVKTVEYGKTRQNYYFRLPFLNYFSVVCVWRCFATGPSPVCKVLPNVYSIVIGVLDETWASIIRCCIGTSWVWKIRKQSCHSLNCSQFKHLPNTNMCNSGIGCPFINSMHPQRETLLHDP
jgi:hypothetical protein